MPTTISVVVFLLAAVLTLPARALPIAARQEKPADAAGTWALTVETANGTGNPTVT